MLIVHGMPIDSRPCSPSRDAAAQGTTFPHPPTSHPRVSGPGGPWSEVSATCPPGVVAWWSPGVFSGVPLPPSRALFPVLPNCGSAQMRKLRRDDLAGFLCCPGAQGPGRPGPWELNLPLSRGWGRAPLPSALPAAASPARKACPGVSGVSGMEGPCGHDLPLGASQRPEWEGQAGRTRWICSPCPMPVSEAQWPQ